MNDFNIPGWDTPDTTHEHVRWLRQGDRVLGAAVSIPIWAANSIADRYEAMDKWIRENGIHNSEDCSSLFHVRVDGVRRFYACDCGLEELLK